MVAMQRANPWSAGLFEDARGTGTEGKIQRLLGDATEIVPALPEAYFEFCVHDPATNSMSGELYSLEFYTALRRLMIY